MDPINFSRNPSVEELEKFVINNNNQYFLADNSDQIKLQQAEKRNKEYHEEIIHLLRKNSELRDIIEGQGKSSVILEAAKHENDKLLHENKILNQKLSDSENRITELNLQIITLSTTNTHITKKTSSNSDEYKKDTFINKEHSNAWLEKIINEIHNMEALNEKVIEKENASQYSSIAKAYLSQLVIYKYIFEGYLMECEFDVMREPVTKLLDASIPIKDLLTTFVHHEPKSNVNEELLLNLRVATEALQKQTVEFKQYKFFIENKTRELDRLLEQKEKMLQDSGLECQDLKIKLNTANEIIQSTMKKHTDRELIDAPVKIDITALNEVIEMLKDIIESLAAELQDKDKKIIRSDTSNQAQQKQSVSVDYNSLNEIILKSREEIQHLKTSLEVTQKKLQADEPKLDKDNHHTTSQNPNLHVHEKMPNEMVGVNLRGKIAELEAQLKQTEAIAKENSFNNNLEWQAEVQQLHAAYNSSQLEYQLFESVIGDYERQFRDIQVLIKTLCEIEKLEFSSESLSLIPLSEHPLPFSAYFNRLEVLYVQLRHEFITMKSKLDDSQTESSKRGEQLEVLNHHLNNKTGLIQKLREQINQQMDRLKHVESLKEKSEKETEETVKKMKRVIHGCKKALELHRTGHSAVYKRMSNDM